MTESCGENDLRQRAFYSKDSHMVISQPNSVEKSRNYGDVCLNEHLCYKLGAKIQH
jgi:hypothetical protein